MPSIQIHTNRNPRIHLPREIKVSRKDEALFRQLINAANAASANAYQPYSQYSVGAAALTFDGQIHTGFNIENCGYSQTIHAEESAVSGALNAGVLQRAQAAGLSQFESIPVLAVAGPKCSDPWPCCNCRQFLGEFGYNMLIIGEIPAQGNRIACLTLGQLVPHAFPIKEVLESVRAPRTG